MERADHIFVGIKIYARLSADARIHLGEQGCRDLDKIDAAQIGCCSKTGHITDYTAAEGAGTIVYVARDGQFLGSILISDEEKPTAGTAMQGLQAQGVRTVMLTGDAPAVAELVAKDLGIDEVVTVLMALMGRF